MPLDLAPEVFIPAAALGELFRRRTLLGSATYLRLSHRLDSAERIKRIGPVRRRTGGWTSNARLVEAADPRARQSAAGNSLGEESVSRAVQTHEMIWGRDRK